MEVRRFCRIEFFHRGILERSNDVCYRREALDGSSELEDKSRFRRLVLAIVLLTLAIEGCDTCASLRPCTRIDSRHGFDDWLADGRRSDSSRILWSFARTGWFRTVATCLKSNEASLHRGLGALL